ncbi:MAG: polyprenol monophosphomannose synthase [Thaumarchaeota archaeon]|nr:polyprenol monophosphomannose synthase [Nitrososphaerota archaeon]
MDPPLTVCVVIPTYNERENVEAIVEAIEGTRLASVRVLFVDDASPDGTGELVKSVAGSRPWVSLLQREKKMGIGSAYQDGFKAAIAGTDAGVLIEIDADLQHPASAIPLLVDAIRNGADVAVGSRYVPGGGISGWSRVRRIVSKGANSYARFMLGLKVRDATSGLRAYTRETARAVADARLPAKGFEFQVAALHLLKDRAKIVEVPYVFTTRAAGKSKLSLGDMARFFFSVARISIFGSSEKRP